MSTQHTPGPWEIRARNIIYPVSRPERVAQVFCPLDVPGEPGTLDANARLIAAAPELLEALAEIVRGADKNATLHDALAGTVILANARAAIAKAEGGKP